MHVLVCPGLQPYQPVGITGNISIAQEEVLKQSPKNWSGIIIRACTYVGCNRHVYWAISYGLSYVRTWWTNSAMDDGMSKMKTWCYNVLHTICQIDASPNKTFLKLLTIYPLTTACYCVPHIHIHVVYVQVYIPVAHSLGLGPWLKPPWPQWLNIYPPGTPSESGCVSPVPYHHGYQHTQRVGTAAV